MNTSEDVQENYMNELQEKSSISSSQKSKHSKYFSDTFSTNNCTIDLDKTKTTKFFTEEDSKKNINKGKFSQDFPDRLISFKQMVDNKKKFLKIEQDLKEIEECTFRPKTNLTPVKSSLTQINQKQLDYAKSRNTAKLKPKAINSQHSAVRPPAPKPRDQGIYEKLYRDSKIFLRGKLQRTFN